MKKIFLFAFALVASVLAFTSCDPNNPTNPSEINVKDYVGSTWFLDSVAFGGHTTTHMCQPIFLTSETAIQIGNNESSFRFENGILYITHNAGDPEAAYTLVSLDEKGAVVTAGKDDNVCTYYISALPTLDRNKQNTVSESAIIGKYKMVIGSMTQTNADGSVETSYTTGGMITWMTFKADNKMLYEDSSSNPDMEGIWELYAGEKKMRYGTYSSLAEMREYGPKFDILVLNDDYLVTGEDYDYDPSMGFTHRHYESVLVRVK